MRHQQPPNRRSAGQRAALDAAFFHLYRIGREDVEHILSTFQGLRQRGPLLLGEYTAGQILEEYERLAG